MISIVTGTLNRLDFLPNLIDNTVNSNDNLELVLVDGGSTDGTIEYIKNLNHPKIILVEVGGRSSYPHFMNLGIQNASHELICQWNDDVLLVNSWDDVIKEIDKDFDFYLFNWKYGDLPDINNDDWITGRFHPSSNKGWCIVDESSIGGHVIMNYGIYSKKIFREIGMYNTEYNYYWADSDMSIRAHLFGYNHKTLPNIKVCSLNTEKRAIQDGNSESIYYRCLEEYKIKFLNKNIEILL